MSRQQPITPTLATQSIKTALRSSGVAYTQVESRSTRAGVVTDVYIRDNDPKTMGKAVHAINAGTACKRAQRAGSSNLIDVEW